MYIGIDVGTRFLGWAVVNEAGDHGRSGWIEFKSKEKGWPGLKERLFLLAGWIDDFVADHIFEDIKLVGIEYPHQRANSQTAIKLGIAWGIVAGAVMARGFEIERIHPTQAKAAMTGSGAATKEQMILYAGFMGAQCEGRGADDQADAIGVALAARSLARSVALG